MKCPKCAAEMETVRFGSDYRLERCSGCQGLFCLEETLAQIKQEMLAESILDIGDRAHGQTMDQTRDTPCPNCGTLMQSLPDEFQAHITLERCPSCTGVFLDAGEFTDLTEFTLLDQIKGWLVRWRS